MENYYDYIDLIDAIKNNNLNMFEQAFFMRDICAKHSMTQSALAKLLNVSQSSIGNKIRLLQYSEQERNAILLYQLSERHARALLRIFPPKRAKLIEAVGKQRLTVQQTEELIEKYSENHFEDAPLELYSAVVPCSIDVFLHRIQSGADQLRQAGNTVTCLLERGESWHRVTVTIRK